MTIKLRFDAHPKYSARRVWTEDESLTPVAGLLDSDLQAPPIARELAQELRDVISGKRESFEGGGNRYFVRARSTHTEIGVDDRAEPITISVSTADLIAAIEEWAAYLEQRLKKTGSYL